jgi:hypothetical protein
MEVTLARCNMCGQFYQASEHHKCLLKPTQDNVISAIEKIDATKPRLEGNHITKLINEMIWQEHDLKEKILAESIEENDFLVGSPILKAELENVYKNMRVLYSPWV